jgi:hypothetical protein
LAAATPTARQAARPGPRVTATEVTRPQASAAIAFAEEGPEVPQVLAGRDVRNDAPVLGVEGDLAVDPLARDPGPGSKIATAVSSQELSRARITG